MKRAISIILLFTIVVILTGCGTSNINIVHNPKTSITEIKLADKSYILSNSKEIRNDYGRTNIILKNASSSIKSYISNDIDCKNIQYRVMPNLSNKRAYYNTSTKEDTYISNANNCTTEVIDDIEFHECKYKDVISKDILGPNGIIEKKYIVFQNKQCFYKLKNLLKNK